MPLPQPISNTDFFLAALLEKLEEIRRAVIDVETALEKLNTSPTPNTTERPIIQLDSVKVADAITKAMQMKQPRKGRSDGN